MGTLLNRRRYMGGGSSLPYDAEVEYLQGNTKYAYIETGIMTYNQMVGIDIEMRMPDYIHDTWFAGYNFYYVRDDRGGFQIGQYNNTNLIGFYDSNTSSHEKYTSAISPYSSQWHRYVINALSKGIEIDGTAKVSDQITNYGSRGGEILLFRRGGNMTIIEGVSQIKFAKLYINNNSLVRDYIPVRVGQVGYLYDKVSGQLFGNASTGDFVLGPDKT